MEKFLVLATRRGVIFCERKGEQWSVINQGLPDRVVNCVLIKDNVVLAGTREGVFASHDEGYSWRRSSSGLNNKHVRELAYYPSLVDLLFVGTEPAAIYVSYEGGELWRPCPEVSQMREQYGWRLPYSPQAGCVRGFAFHQQRAYAAVEDGGVLVSADGGENWRLAEGSRGTVDHQPAAGYIHSDVHSIYTHPSSHDLVFAPTGGGFYRSEDGGKSWTQLHDGYVRAAWINPEDTSQIILGPAGGVDSNGRIETSQNRGKTWQRLYPDLENGWKDTMVERFIALDQDLLAVLSNGELLSARFSDLIWKTILPEAGWVMDAAVLSRDSAGGGIK